MELKPTSKNDETPGDDSSESVVVERFGFLQEDREIIQELIAGVRRALKRKSITPQQICGLGKLLHGLERLPRPTSGIGIVVTTGSSGAAEEPRTDSFYQSIELCESIFRLWSGGSEYTPGVGGDTYTSFLFQVTVDGFRDDTEVAEVYDWMCGFTESLCNEDQDFRLHDEANESVLAWDEKTPENDWDHLDSGFV